MEIFQIPKKIYYVWLGGKKPQKVINCINNWKEKLSDFEIIEINETTKELFDIEEECNNNLWFRTCYENKLWAYVSDYIRLKVLYRNGGVYFDTDITVEKDITALVNKNKLILGREHDLYIGSAFFITPKQNFILEQMIDFYKKRVWKEKIYTLTQLFTDIIQKNYNIDNKNINFISDDIEIFMPEYFYPIPSCVYKNQLGYITPETYIIHWWNVSWGASNIEYFLRHKSKKELATLIDKCFTEKVIFQNYFIKIKKLCNKLTIDLDFYYFFRFRHRYYEKQKYLTLIFAGIQIKIWKRRINEG